MEILFNINGGIIQSITKFTDESDLDFFNKIKSGEYVVSIISKKVYKVGPFDIVGTVYDQEVTDDTEYTDFELLEE